MKLIFILLTAAMFSVHASGVSQNITLTVKGAPLEKVFSLVKKETNYVFFYKKEDIQDAKPVSIEVHNLPIDQFLQKLLYDQPLKFSIEKQTVIISRKEVEADVFPGQIPLPAAPPVTGFVRGSDGQPLGSVNIIIKGSKRGVMAAADGGFTIDASEGEVLVFSFIGYQTKEIRIGNQPMLGIIVLSLSESKLDEVQIQAYGKTSRRLSTANISTVKGEDIAKQPVANALMALQGRVPGLVVTQMNGLPNSGIRVRIQGQNSMRFGAGTSEPFYVIDGVPYHSDPLPSVLGEWLSGLIGAANNPMSFINPADIERIDVLKDADATSIYGSRAANGAILITTKKGKSGRISSSLNIQSGIGRVTRRMKLLNTQQYVALRKEGIANSGVPLSFNDDYDLTQWDTTRYTDWQKELLGKPVEYQDAQASLSGGAQNLNFLISTGYHRETTVHRGNFGNTKGSVRLNINVASPNNRLKLSVSGSYLLDRNRIPGTNLVSAALRLAPNAPPLFQDDGSLNYGILPDGRSSFENPLISSYGKSQAITGNLIGNAKISWQLFPWLEVSSTMGYTNTGTSEISYRNISAKRPSDQNSSDRTATYSDGAIKSWILEPQLNFTKKFGEWQLGILAGGTLQARESHSRRLVGQDYPNDMMQESIDFALSVRTLGSTDLEYKYAAAFARFNLSLKNRYILNLVGRRDGSSRFGPANKFSNFGSAAFAWVFSEEPFLENKLSFLDFGKLNVSYGTTGSDQIGDYTYMSTYFSDQAAIPYQNMNGLRPAWIVNPYLEWEETRKLNIGLSLSFLKNRISTELNYYFNRTSNQLLNMKLSDVTGFGGIATNLPGVVQNNGLELLINTVNLKIRGFKWESTINATFPRNRLVSFPNIGISNFARDYKIGEPVSVIRQYHYAGINSETGRYQFYDKNGTITYTPNDESRNYPINYDPVFYASLQNQFSYTGFQLDLLFSYVKQDGNQMSAGDIPGAFLSHNGFGNQPIEVMDHWRKQGDQAKVAKVSTNRDPAYGSSSFYMRNSNGTMMNASYIRLKNVALSWKVPETFFPNWKNKAIRLFVNGQNLLTFTKYIGLDPETNIGESLPPLRVVTFGVKLDF